MFGTRAKSDHWCRWAMQVFMPCFATVVLLGVVIFLIVVPTLARSILERKKETIRELTRAAWCLLDENHRAETTGQLSREDAQARAVAQVRGLRYGANGKDYFWINDMQPRMVMHPYRHDLDGQDLSDFSDPNGKRLFVSFAETVRDHGEGYVDYHWQWQDDESRIVPKLSFVMGFAPWEWIVGTGIYTEDIRAEIADLTRKLVFLSSCILLLVLFLSLWIVTRSVRSEAQRRHAEQALETERQQLLSIFDSIEEPVYVSDPHTYDLLYFNSAFKRLWGDGTDKKCYQSLQNRESPCPCCTNGMIFGENIGQPYIWEFQNPVIDRWFRCIDKAIRWPDGRLVRYEMAIDITERKIADAEREARLLSVRKQHAAVVRLATAGAVASGGFDQAARSITETVAGAVEVERAGIWLNDDEAGEMRCVDLYERTPNRHSSGIALSSQEYPGYIQALDVERVIAADRAVIDPRTREYAKDYLVPLCITSLLDAPIRVSGRVVGVVCLEHTGAPRTWRTEEIAFAGEIADQAAQAFINGERRQAEQALRKSEQHLRMILTSIQAGILIIDADSRQIIDVNPAATKMIRATREEIVGRLCHEFLCPSEIGNCPVTDGGKSIDAADRILLRADGQAVEVLKTVTQMVLNDRRVLLESFVDISDRKRAEEELRRRVDELSEAKRRLEVLVSNVTGREKRMVELKQEVNELLVAQGIGPKYSAPQEIAALRTVPVMEGR